METAVSSTSFPEDMWAWLATRLLRPRIALLWLVLSACIGAASAPVNPLRAMLLAALFIAQFRLWDDLADRAHDARHHRNRVLPRSVHGARFGLVCGAAALPILLMLWLRDALGASAAYMLLCAAMGLLYLASRACSRLMRAHLVLLKYPMFIAIAASGRPWLLVLGLGAGLWLLLAAHELLSDKTINSIN